jgi:hypothetical protein
MRRMRQPGAVVISADGDAPLVCCPLTAAKCRSSCHAHSVPSCVLSDGPTCSASPAVDDAIVAALVVRPAVSFY